MITFDLKNSNGRQAQYKKADAHLVFVYGKQNFWKIMKQVKIIRTNHDPRQIRDSLHQNLMGNCNILVVRIRKGYAFKIIDPALRLIARDCLQQLPGAEPVAQEPPRSRAYPAL
jgi:hypothetical protein